MNSLHDIIKFGGLSLFWCLFWLSLNFFVDIKADENVSDSNKKYFRHIVSNIIAISIFNIILIIYLFYRDAINYYF